MKRKNHTHYLISGAFICFLIFCLMDCSQKKEKEFLGHITEIKLDKKSYKIGDEVSINITVKNDSPERRHYVVAIEILNSRDYSVYDSHNRSRVKTHNNDDCKIFWLDPGDSHIAGPFHYKLSKQDIAGVYHILTGLRIFPWDKVVQFRGLSWCLPEEKFSVSR